MNSALNRDRPVIWGRMTMCEVPVPSHAFLEEPGRLRLRLSGESLADLVAEGGRALGSRMRGQTTRGPSGSWVEVEFRAGGREAVLAEWLNRLLDRAGRNRWAPVECQVIEVSDSSLHARVRGVPLPEPPRLGKAVIRPDSISALEGQGLQVEVILEAPGPDAGDRAAPQTASPSTRAPEHANPVAIVADGLGLGNRPHD